MPAPRPGASLTPTTEAKEHIMAIGPVQLLVLGFKEPNFSGEIRAELDRLRDNDLIRVIDALAVRKDADGEVQTLHESQLSADEQAAFGALIGGLIGLGAAGEEGFELGAERGAEAVAERGGVFDEDEAWDVVAEIPTDTAGLLVLLEHRWASRCATRSPGRAGSGWPRSSSARWTWSRSAWSRPRRPKRWRRPTAAPSEAHHRPTER
jgi:uncharacterized membrane protein